jgi:hypothetical protein
LTAIAAAAVERSESTGLRLLWVLSNVFSLFCVLSIALLWYQARSIYEPDRNQLMSAAAAESDIVMRLKQAGLWFNGIAFVALLMLVSILLFGLSWAASARVGKWTAVLDEILGQDANAELRGRTGPFADLDRRMSQFIHVVEANRSAIEQASRGDLEWSLVARPDPLSRATEALRKRLEEQASRETERAE